LLRQSATNRLRQGARIREEQAVAGGGQVLLCSRAMKMKIARLLGASGSDEGGNPRCAHQHPETDWTVVGSDLLLLGWFGFLYLLLYLLAFSATMPP
jgi:hypothetical protein